MLAIPIVRGMFMFRTPKADQGLPVAEEHEPQLWQTVRELAAAVGTNADTRLASITVRGRVQVLRTIAHFEERAGKKAAKEQARQEKQAQKALAKGKKAKEIDTGGAGVTYRTMARLYTAYAKLYIRATESGSRRHPWTMRRTRRSCTASSVTWRSRARGSEARRERGRRNRDPARRRNPCAPSNVVP